MVVAIIGKNKTVQNRTHFNHITRLALRIKLAVGGGNHPVVIARTNHHDRIQGAATFSTEWTLRLRACIKRGEIDITGDTSPRAWVFRGFFSSERE